MIIIIIALQLLMGFLMGFAGTWMVNFNEFQEIGIFIIGVSLGVSMVGIISQEVYKSIKLSKQMVYVLNTFIGAVFGAFLVILLESANHIDDYILPLLFAIIGYYYTNLIARILKD